MTELQRNIPVELRRRLLIESGHRCSIPQCGHNANLDIHHIKPWSEYKEHSFENLIVLCPNCHRLVHDGKIDRKSLFEYKNRLSTNSSSINYNANYTQLDKNNFNRLISVIPIDIFYKFKMSAFGDHRTMDFLQPLYFFIDLCNDPTFLFGTENLEIEKLSLHQEAVSVTTYVNNYLQRDSNGLIRIGPTEGQLGCDTDAMLKWSSIINECTFKVYDFLQNYDSFARKLTLQLS